MFQPLARERQTLPRFPQNSRYCRDQAMVQEGIGILNEVIDVCRSDGLSDHRSIEFDQPDRRAPLTADKIKINIKQD